MRVFLLVLVLRHEEAIRLKRPDRPAEKIRTCLLTIHLE